MADDAHSDYDGEHYDESLKTGATRVVSFTLLAKGTEQAEDAAMMSQKQCAALRERLAADGSSQALINSITVTEARNTGSYPVAAHVVVGDVSAEERPHIGFSGEAHSFEIFPGTSAVPVNHCSEFLSGETFLREHGELPHDAVKTIETEGEVVRAGKKYYEITPASALGQYIQKHATDLGMELPDGEMPVEIPAKEFFALKDELIGQTAVTSFHDPTKDAPMIRFTRGGGESNGVLDQNYNLNGTDHELDMDGATAGSGHVAFVCTMRYTPLGVQKAEDVEQ